MRGGRIELGASLDRHSFSYRRHALEQKSLEPPQSVVTVVGPGRDMAPAVSRLTGFTHRPFLLRELLHLLQSTSLEKRNRSPLAILGCSLYSVTVSMGFSMLCGFSLCTLWASIPFLPR